MKVQFVFIAGVEGCGHHGLCPVIDAAFNASKPADCNRSAVFTRWPPIRQLFNALWYTPSLTPQQRAALRAQVGELMARGRQIAAQSGCPQYIVEDNSFPSGMQRDLGHQWDMVEMVELLRPHAEVRVIGLYRDPIAMTFSHEDWDGGPREHARLVADYLELVNGQLLRLDPDIVKVVHYEDLVDNQASLAAPLAACLGVDTHCVEAGFQTVRKSRKDWKTEMGPDNRAWMLEFFDAQRRARWPVFSDPGYNLVDLQARAKQ